MAARANRWKLGLFVLLAMAAVVGVVAFLGARSLHRESVTYTTYFNESVTGLDIGAPVKFRGVTIGHVSAIEIAPDHRHVEVRNDLDVAEIKRMGLVETGREGRKPRFLVPRDLRTQLGTQGITGVKFLAIDFFDERANPPPPLPFPPPDNYIPAANSMMKNLEDTLTKAMDRLPELVDAVVAIMGRVDRIVAVLEKDDVAGTLVTTLKHADETLTSVQHTLHKIDLANVPEKAAATITDLDVAVGKMNKVLDRIDGDQGLVASATRAAESFGEVGRRATGTTRDLDAALRDVREAAEAIRALADALEQDPDMLLKGRAKGKSR